MLQKSVVVLTEYRVKIEIKCTPVSDPLVNTEASNTPTGITLQGKSNVRT